MAEEPWISIWILVRSWITPTALFVLLNIVIGTIALTSKAHSVHRRHENAPDGHPVARTASSALNRLRSISLSRLRSGDFFTDLVPVAVALTPDESAEPSSSRKVDEKVGEKVDEKVGCHRVCQSPSEAHLVEADCAVHARMDKSASERLATELPAVGRAAKSEEVKGKAHGKETEEETEDGVDARADDFINRFRQQLHLQRLNSLLRYKDMIGRGK